MTKKELNGLKKAINKLYGIISRTLGVSPQLIFDKEFDDEDECFACFRPYTNSVCIDIKRIFKNRKGDEYNAILDICFCIVHEMRHCYQCKHFEPSIFDYPSAEINYHEYVSSFAEVDANAFAFIFMDQVFDVNNSHLFEPDIMNLIRVRMEFINKFERPIFI